LACMQQDAPDALTLAAVELSTVVPLARVPE
jgi:hypothetical protein